MEFPRSEYEQRVERALALMEGHGVDALMITGDFTASIAQYDVVNAAKEGGFLGFGAEQVSEREQAMIEQVRAAVSA